MGGEQGRVEHGRTIPLLESICETLTEMPLRILLLLLLVASCSTTNSDAPISGRVVILLDVDKSGATDNIRVLESDPPGFFDQEAIKAAKKWKYKQGSSKENHRVVIDFKLSPEEQAGEVAK
ncbi:energy transducer TonB [Oligoflexus tunisiensis]|uniref:energy transducer TonB n=1 Tax=Oligoflexus tunisiensis TaxID=708132 RepID=UPI00114CF7F1|nr:energy transducer TonB [Oligoflexus tunisiensis]